MAEFSKYVCVNPVPITLRLPWAEFLPLYWCFPKTRRNISEDTGSGGIQRTKEVGKKPMQLHRPNYLTVEIQQDILHFKNIYAGTKVALKAAELSSQCCQHILNLIVFLEGLLYHSLGGVLTMYVPITAESMSELFKDCLKITP